MSATRTVFQGDAFDWLSAQSAAERTSVITSLPDVSELPAMSIDAYAEWFVRAARTVIRWVPASGVAIFFQSDIRRGGTWLDKGYLVMRAAEQEKAPLVWHKIVCRKPAGTIAVGRPSYSHMICVARAPRPRPLRPGPDVLPDAGFMPWPRAMGASACRVACAFLRDETDTRVVVDPFCGRGTVLAVANAMGFDAVGVDTGAKRCRAARALLIVDPRGHESARDALDEGARLFDRGAYWQAHEAWETRWRVETDAVARRALQGLIQIAAAFHKHAVMDAPESAARLLTRGLAKLDGVPSGDRLAGFRDALRASALDLSRVPKLSDRVADDALDLATRRG